jgi:hypothetical protein
MKALIFFGCVLLSLLAKADRFEIFSENGKMGIKNERGVVIIPASFEALGWSDGSFSVIGNVTGYRANSHWGILNLKREFVTQAIYEALIYGGADNIIARKKINPAQSKTGCINLSGETKIPFHYEGIAIHGLRAIVFTFTAGRYRYGLIDLENHPVIPTQYATIYPLGTLRYAVENDQGKIALFREDGKAVTGFKIDSISKFINGRAVVYENLHRGLIDREGNIILPAIYRDIRIGPEDEVWTQAPHEWLFITRQNEIVDRLEADELTCLSEKVFRVKQSGKFGLVDQTLKALCPIQYDELTPLKNEAYIARIGGKAGILLADGTVKIPFRYDSLLNDGDFIRAFHKIEGWSVINLQYETISQKQYDWIGPGAGGLHPVINNHYWGVIDSYGKELVHCVFDSLLHITPNRAVVKYKNEYGIIDLQQNWLVTPQSISIRLINDDTYVQQEGKNLIVKSIQNGIIYFTDYELTFQSDSFIELLPDGTQKTIDYNGRVVSRIQPPQVKNVEQIYSSSEGMRGILRDGKYGFIDDRGRLRVANRYDGVGEFHEGLAAFKLIGKWGFVNMHDQIVIQPNYDRVNYFQNGLCVACRNGRCGVIDKNGNAVLNFQYDSIQFDGHNFLLHNSGQRGLADKNGTVLIDPRFHQLRLLQDGLVLVGVEGKWGVISETGLSIIPIIYDELQYDERRHQFLALKKSEWKKAP